jgi:predicted PurR-regulated permease PerM
VFTFFTLLAIGVENALAFAVLAGFADVIPLIGAFIAIIPPAFAAFDQSVTQAIIVLIALLIYQQFEDRFLVPRIYGQTLGLQPLVVFLAVLVGGELLGITGILLSLPAAAAGKVLLDYFLLRRKPGSLLEPNEFTTTREVLAPEEPPADAATAT